MKREGEESSYGGGEVVETLVHPALLPRQVPAGDAQQLAAGERILLPETERLGAAHEE